MIDTRVDEKIKVEVKLKGEEAADCLEILSKVGFHCTLQKARIVDMETKEAKWSCERYPYFIDISLG